MRRRKQSIGLATLSRVERARVRRVLKASRPGGSSLEIILRLEPVEAEFNAEQRSGELSWLDLKQLIEPESKDFELTSQDREKP